MNFQKIATLFICAGLTGPLACQKKDLAAENSAIVKKSLASDMSDPVAKATEKMGELKPMADLQDSMYTEGCQQKGLAQPQLKLHPQLVAGDGYVWEESRSLDNVYFKVKYDLLLNSLPKPNGEIQLSGNIESVSLTNFNEPLLADGTGAVTQKCVLLEPQSGLEKCYDPVQPFSPGLNWALQKYFPKDDCEVQPNPDSSLKDQLKDQWTSGTYRLINDQTIPIYIHRLQTAWIKKCNQGKTTVDLIKTEVIATSNSIVAPNYSHCGGALIYQKEIWRDANLGTDLGSHSTSLLLGPQISN